MGGQLGALGARPRSPWPWRPCPGCRGPPRGGCGAAASLAGLWLSAGRGGEGGGRGGGRGGSPQSPPGAASWQSRGGGLVVPVPGGQPPTGGAHSSPAPLDPLGARPLCRPSLWPAALLTAAAWCPPAGGGGGVASAGDGRSGQRLAVSGLRGSGPPPALIALAISPTGGGARPSAVSYGGGLGVALRAGGPSPAGGGVPRYFPLPYPSRSSPGPAGCGRHLRRRLREGWGCCGGGFRRR